MAKKELVTDGSLVLGSRFVKYQVFYRAKKNIILRVTGRDALAVSLPPRTRRSSREKIEGFLRENEAQILSLLNKFCQKEDEKARDKVNELKNGLNSVFVLGEKYRVVLSEIGEKRREKAVFDKTTKTVLVYVKNKEDVEQVKLVIKKALLPLVKEVCKELNEKCFRDFNALAGVKKKAPLAVITVKNMTSRWGSCTAAKGRISINFRLIHYPRKCIESVFYHEYAHFAEQNHSRAFYDVLKKLYPDYDEANKILKKSKNIYEML